MNLLRRAVAHPGEVVAGEDVENFEEHDAAGRRRRRGDDLAAAIASCERRAVLDLIGREVGGGDEATALLDGGGKFGGNGTFVEARRIGGDALEGAGEFRLSEAVTGLEEIAVALEDAARIGKHSEVLCGGKVARFFLRQNVALAGEADRRGHHPRQREPAIGLLRIDKPRDRAGNANGLVAGNGKASDDVALRVEIHSGAGGGGGALAVVEEVGLARLHADEHEAATAEVSGLREDDGQRESYGHRRVHRIAAGFEDFDAGVRCVVVDADHHGVPGQRRRWADEDVGVGWGCRLRRDR